MRSLVLLLSSLPAICLSQEKQSPNVIVIVADDAGYADFSFQGCKEWQTPNIDRIAKEGVRCTNGYVSGMVCSPTRAGILTGRYQNRFGHEFNPPPVYSETNGLPIDQATFPSLMQRAGYKTVAIGKWHLGYAPKFHPLSRGFTDYYGFLQGARSYWPIEGNQLNELLRDRTPAPEKFDYITDELGTETAGYIAKYNEEPFFLYVCFNAVHTPLHALESDLAKFPNIEDKKRRTLAAMTLGLDRAVGTILDELDRQELTENTLVAFVSDNGGPTFANASNNEPLRGVKGQPFEGGVRVPFAIRWPAKLKAGTVYEQPVIALDFLPTALAVAGADIPDDLDGVNLIPYLTGEKSGRPHETLFWRSGDKKAVRHQDLKLVEFEGKQMLFDLSQDIGEQTDLASKRPEDLKRLASQLASWESELAEPAWQPRGQNRGRNNNPNRNRNRPNRGQPSAPATNK